MGILNRLATKTWSFRSRVYLQHLQKRLKNREFSLITNDCVGGVICHNLNMPFLSPTVNLWMTAEDYLVFLSDLPYFLSCPVEEIHEEGINYPIGLLRKGTETVKLFFMHYECFEQAVEKWTSRAKRVLFDRLYIILDYPADQASEAQQEQIKERFQKLPYPNKVMLTKSSGLHGADIVNLPFYEHFTPGLILKRRNDRTVKRYLDDFDYVGFLNR